MRKRRKSRIYEEEAYCEDERINKEEAIMKFGRVNFEKESTVWYRKVSGKFFEKMRYCKFGLWKGFAVIVIRLYEAEEPEMKNLLDLIRIISRSYQKVGKRLILLLKSYQSFSKEILYESKEFEVISKKTIKDDYIVNAKSIEAIIMNGKQFLSYPM
jgi:hypothetical protein